MTTAFSLDLLTNDGKYCGYSGYMLLNIPQTDIMWTAVVVHIMVYVNHERLPAIYFPLISIKVKRWTPTILFTSITPPPESQRFSIKPLLLRCLRISKVFCCTTTFRRYSSLVCIYLSLITSNPKEFVSCFLRIVEGDYTVRIIWIFNIVYIIRRYLIPKRLNDRYLYFI